MAHKPGTIFFHGIFVLILVAILTIVISSCEQKETHSNTPQDEKYNAAKNKAVKLCSGCHGLQGISSSPFIPNLAGQKNAYMVQQLNDFRSGKRSNHQPMSYIARMLTQEEVHSISAWYSELSPEITKKNN